MPYNSNDSIYNTYGTPDANDSSASMHGYVSPDVRQSASVGAFANHPSLSFSHQPGTSPQPSLYDNELEAEGAVIIGCEEIIQAFNKDERARKLKYKKYNKKRSAKAKLEAGKVLAQNLDFDARFMADFLQKRDESNKKNFHQFDVSILDNTLRRKGEILADAFAPSKRADSSKAKATVASKSVAYSKTTAPSKRADSSKPKATAASKSVDYSETTTSGTTVSKLVTVTASKRAESGMAQGPLKRCAEGCETPARKRIRTSYLKQLVEKNHVENENKKLTAEPFSAKLFYEGRNPHPELREMRKQYSNIFNGYEANLRVTHQLGRKYSIEYSKLKDKDARLKDENARLKSDIARLESDIARLEYENTRLKYENTRSKSV